MQPSQCSPSRYKKPEHLRLNTCVHRQLIRDIYSAMLPSSKQVKSVNLMLVALHRLYGTSRGNEYCWLSDPRTNWTADTRRAFESCYRPAHPISWLQNPRQWLSSLDIMRVMEQYPIRYPRFGFLGVVPLDFDQRLGILRTCVAPELCNFTISELQREKKTCAGAVFNLDRHYQPGSHWVSMYLNIDPKRKNYGVYYYDSTSNPCPKEISDFMTRISTEVNDPKFEMKMNVVQRQFQNTECGVFSMYFLVCCLQGKKSFQEICNSMVRDDKIHTLRRVFFRSPVCTSSSARTKPDGKIR